MDEKFWLDAWQTKNIPFHNQNVNPDLITYIKELNLKPGNTILVPLCGKSKDMFWLAESGFHVIGIELSPIACNDFFTELNITPKITKLSNFAKYHHNNIELLCGNIFNVISTDLPTIHAIYDCKALIALPPDIRKKYVNHLISCTGTKIQILLFSIEANCQIKSPPFPVNKAELNVLYGSDFDIHLLNSFTISTIPERLIKKGYSEMRETIYLISEKLL